MKILVTGHPRSGTNYLAAVVAKNFGLEKYLSHKRPNQLSEAHQKCRIFYIWRNFEDVAKSFMARSDNRVSLETYRSTTWNELYDIFHKEPSDSYPKGKWPGWVERAERKTMTPEQWWGRHVSEWLDFAEQNGKVYILRYEDLTSDFNGTVREMASWLGVKRDSFVNVSEKVDGAAVRPGGFIGNGAFRGINDFLARNAE